MNNPYRDNGGKLPPGLGIIRNATGQREHITTWDEYREHLLKINRNPRYLKPIVKVRSDQWGNGESSTTVWLWECQICLRSSWSYKWQTTYDLANHHAHHHHGEKR